VPDPDLVGRDVCLEALECLERTVLEGAASHVDVRLPIALYRDERRQRLVRADVDPVRDVPVLRQTQLNRN